MHCRYVKQYAANKRQEEKLATSTFNIWMRFKSMSKYDD